MKKKLLAILSCSAIIFTAAVVTATPDKAALPPATASEPAAEVLAGKVLQTMNSGGYSYILIQKSNGENSWVAVTETPVKVGSQMKFKGGMEMGQFESKTLKRTFDKIIFADGVIADPKPAEKAALPTGEKAASPGSKGSVASKDTSVSVSKATGTNAYTVKEAFAGSTKLNKKKVVIRGKVVKVSSQIMGRNWIHIQDGTGTAAAGNHNLVCTSKDTADVGDVVTVSGTLSKDKDFGGGYKYAVIIEDATVKK
ncbi:MAG: OB-fold nucleic acid binding domain-containing protein [Deltaproteobacteria bacterium]|nr:OB-fold nucleic acid binding domain-containing protein [Deltaproteobacteria bacterium]